MLGTDHVLTVLQASLSHHSIELQAMYDQYCLNSFVASLVSFVTMHDVTLFAATQETLVPCHLTMSSKYCLDRQGNDGP